MSSVISVNILSTVINLDLCFFINNANILNNREVDLDDSICIDIYK